MKNLSGPKLATEKRGIPARLARGMTGESVHQDGRIFCHWFAGHKLEGGPFEPDAIGLEDNLDPLKTKKIAE